VRTSAGPSYGNREGDRSRDWKYAIIPFILTISRRNDVIAEDVEEPGYPHCKPIQHFTILHFVSHQTDVSKNSQIR